MPSFSRNLVRLCTLAAIVLGMFGLTWRPAYVSAVRLAFIRPLSPSAAVRPPKVDDWLQRAEMARLSLSNHQGTAARSGSIRHGAEYTDRLPDMVEAFSKLPTQSAILDGDLCLIDYESELMFLAFDLLHQDGVDLRGLPLSERKRDLDRLCRRSKVPRMRRVETFPDGESCLTTATSSGSRASFPSAWSHAIRVDRAATGSRSSARIGSA